MKLNWFQFNIDNHKKSAINRHKLCTGKKMLKNMRILSILAALCCGLLICGWTDISQAAKFSVVIDPAHGGDDSGVKITDKISEKNITLAVAIALQSEFSKDKDIEIRLTRDADKTVTIDDRQNAVLKSKTDLFLSLHVNGGFGKNASGFELYYPGFKEVAETQGKKKDSVKEARIKSLNESVRLAQILQKKLDEIFPRKGRGLREAQIPVMEGLSIPALTVEVGFATNQEERKKLLSVEGQNEIAKSLAKGIKLFFR